MNIEDLLIDFDEMGFAPTTICPNPDEYACGWKMKLVAEINRQQSEIESLKIENQSLRSAANSYKLHYNEARTEAVKEFAERLKATKFKHDNDYIIYAANIDVLMKEMTGDAE